MFTLLAIETIEDIGVSYVTNAYSICNHTMCFYLSLHYRVFRVNIVYGNAYNCSLALHLTLCTSFIVSIFIVKVLTPTTIALYTIECILIESSFGCRAYPFTVDTYDRIRDDLARVHCKILKFGIITTLFQHKFQSWSDEI